MTKLLRRICRRLGIVSAVSLLPLSLQAQPSGQWDFDKGDLSATVGAALQFADGAGAATSQQTRFGTTASFAISDIGGSPAQVMRFPAAAAGMGFTMPAPRSANGGGTLVNNWTLVLDVLFPAESDGKVRALVDADGGLINVDSELFVGANGGIGVGGQFDGKLQANTWYRIGFVVSGQANAIEKYINGVRVGTQPAGGLDGRWALAPAGTALLFADDNDQTAVGYVNSIQLRDAALSGPQMLALGGPVAAGIPSVLPPIPSFVEQTIPLTTFAAKGTDVGFILNTGDTTIQDSSISLKLDGTAVASPSISRSGKLITVSKSGVDFIIPSKHTIELSYTDSLKGQQTASHQFDIVVFIEDFDSLKLGDSVWEGGGGVPGVWTKTAPTGWKIDDSKMAAIDDPSVGVPEWEGWSFANKDFWARVAGDQNRTRFTLGKNTVAIADPDEWDDTGRPVASAGYFNSFLTTPPIAVAGLPANSIFVRFDSSWRPEGFDDAGPDGQSSNNQTATVTVSYDGGSPVQIFKYDSDPKSATFKGDSENETVIVDAKNPAGAKQMVLTFALTNSGNDWWWAFDNLIVNVGVKPPKIAQEPKALEVTAGQPASFTVVAEGDSLSYQWFKGQATTKTAITGATQAKFTIPAAALADAGTYSVEVSNPGGKAASALVDLNVLPDLGGTILFAENFDGLPLSTNVNEALFGAKVWTKKAPAGWTIDDTSMAGIDDPASGVTEWKGWSFADAKWWASTAGDQRRSEFTKASGAAAIADPDEWDDRAPASSLGTFNSFLKTPPITLTGIKANSAILRFNSSWRPEGNQTATVTVSYDGGAAVEVLTYKETTDDKTNETLDLNLKNPANANSMVITFGLTEAGNNWFWAIDNIVVKAERPPLFSEDFEGLKLGPNVEEGITTGSGGAKTNVWIKTPPAGWAIDDKGVPGAGTDNDGVKEWAGWSFANRAWWASTAGDQQRTQFTKGTGAVAIADGDEWDDLPRSAGQMSTFLSTRPIEITGQAANTLLLKFDSSWRDEPDQKANVRVSYDGGAPVEVLRWESVESSPNFHNDAVNETVTVSLRNPAAAKSMVITFGYLDAGNNWWWAIDNISVIAGEAPPPSVAPTIATQPQGTTVVAAGATVTLTIAANGTAPLAYQWKKDGQNIAGATQATLTLNNVQVSDSGSYTVAVSNAAGSVTSASALVTVNPIGKPSTPTLTLPAAATIFESSFTIVGSPFVGGSPTTVNAAAVLQLSANSGFSPAAGLPNLLHSITNSTGSTTISVPTQRLFPGQIYYASMQYQDQNGNKSDFATPVALTVSALPTPIASETFESTADFGVPSGWTVTNQTDTGTAGANPASPVSDTYKDWVVVPFSTLVAFGGGRADFTNVVNGKSIYAESDNRGGNQIQVVLSPEYNLSGRNNVWVAFKSNYVQNQDSIGVMEYTVDGGNTWLPLTYLIDDQAGNADVVRTNGVIDATATLTRTASDIAKIIDPATGQRVAAGKYADFVLAKPIGSLGPYISGRINDDKTESRRYERFRIAAADNQPKVQFRFVQAGTGSWWWGIDDFGLYSAGAAAGSSLSASRQGNNLVLSWTVSGTLQSADEVTGPWTDVAGAKSPQSLAITGQRKFYRLRQ